MSDSISINTDELKVWADGVGAAADTMPLATAAAVLVGANLIASDANDRVRPFSKSIHVSASPATTDTAVVLASSSEGGPIASLMEHGGSPGSWRHPVYGHEPYVSQQAHPYLQPAAEANEATIAEGVEKTVTDPLEGFLSPE